VTEKLEEASIYKNAKPTPARFVPRDVEWVSRNRGGTFQCQVW